MDIIDLTLITVNCTVEINVQKACKTRVVLKHTYDLVSAGMCECVFHSTYSGHVIAQNMYFTGLHLKING